MRQPKQNQPARMKNSGNSGITIRSLLCQDELLVPLSP